MHWSHEASIHPEHEEHVGAVEPSGQEVIEVDEHDGVAGTEEIPIDVGDVVHDAPVDNAVNVAPAVDDVIEEELHNIDEELHDNEVELQAVDDELHVLPEADQALGSWIRSNCLHMHRI